jgi:hypothetical protein
MRGAFGDRGRVANGVLFATYHLHVPWAIPTALLDTFLLSYPAKRYQSRQAWRARSRSGQTSWVVGSVAGRWIVRRLAHATGAHSPRPQGSSS